MDGGERSQLSGRMVKIQKIKTLGSLKNVSYLWVSRRWSTEQWNNMYWVTLDTRYSEKKRLSIEIVIFDHCTWKWLVRNNSHGVQLQCLCTELMSVLNSAWLRVSFWVYFQCIDLWIRNNFHRNKFSSMLRISQEVKQPLKVRLLVFSPLVLTSC